MERIQNYWKVSEFVGQKMIAIVEKQLKNIDDLKKLIENEIPAEDMHRYNIRSFSDVDHFMNIVPRTNCNTVILDLDDGGIEVARKFRENNKNANLVLSSSTRDYAAESYELNASFFLLKPFNPKMVHMMWKKLQELF